MLRDRYIRIVLSVVEPDEGLILLSNIDNISTEVETYNGVGQGANPYYYLGEGGYYVNVFNIFSLFPTVGVIYLELSTFLNSVVVSRLPTYDTSNVGITSIQFSDAIYYDLDAFFFDCAISADTLKNTSFYNSVLPPPIVSAPSLNGNGAEYTDGVFVTVNGRETVYTVKRSYMTIYSDSGYTVHYDLESASGEKLSSPEALLTKYVASVTTP